MASPSRGATASSACSSPRHGPLGAHTTPHHTTPRPHRQVSLYKGYSEGGGSPRSGNSSAAVADVSMEVGGGHHSTHSVDSPPQRGARSGPVGPGDDEDHDTPVMAFGSAPNGRGATLADA